MIERKGISANYVLGKNGFYTPKTQNNDAWEFGNALLNDINSGNTTFTNSDSLGSITKISVSLWSKTRFRIISDTLNSGFFQVNYNPANANRVATWFYGSGSGQGVYNFASIEPIIRQDINHWVVVYDGTEPVITDRVKLYLNKTFIAGSSASPGYPSSLSSDFLNNLLIQGGFDSEINELVIDVGKALTQPEVDSLNNNMKGSDYIETMGYTPYVYCKFNEEDGAAETENIGTLGVNGTINDAHFTEFLPTIQPLFTYKKIALAGQSNAVSYNSYELRPVDLELNYFNSIYLKDSILYNMSYGFRGIGLNSNINHGYGVEFRITDNYIGSENIAWLKYAVGGTSVGPAGGSAWADNGYLTLGFIAEAKSINYTPEWLIWIQGEQDALTSGDSSTYETNLKATFQKFRDELGANLKILIVGLYQFDGIPNSTYYNSVKNAQIAIASEQANSFYFDPVTDAGIVDPNDIKDDFHYNSSGIDKIANECYAVISNN